MQPPTSVPFIDRENSLRLVEQFQSPGLFHLIHQGCFCCQSETCGITPRTPVQAGRPKGSSQSEALTRCGFNWPPPMMRLGYAL